MPSQPAPVPERDEKQRKGFMSLRTIRLMIDDRRPAPIRQTISKTLGGTALTCAMLLGFVNSLWALQVSPSALTFSAASGGTDPSPQTIVLSTPRSKERTWAATVNASWITITPSSGSITTENDTVSVKAIAAGLAAGSYSANVTITETGLNGRVKRTILPVTLSILEAAAKTTSTATSATLTWTANAESDLAGYKIYSGTQSGVYGTPVSIGKVTSHLLTNLSNGTTYFFTITAYDIAGNESIYAPELSKSIY
jgi:flagellar hook-associated protein FlgK